MAEELPKAVREFITAHVESAGHLEVLLLLRAVPGRDWPVHDVARAQVTSPDTARQFLDDLWREGLLSVPEPGSYRYDPPAERAPTIDQLAEAYATRRVAVVGLIFSKPSRAVTGLSDAFRIKRRP